LNCNFDHSFRSNQQHSFIALKLRAMASLGSTSYGAILIFIALFISLVTATPIQNNEVRQDVGVPGFPLHTVHLIPDSGIHSKPTYRPHGPPAPVNARNQDAGVAGFPLHTVHLTPASDPIRPAATTIQLATDKTGSIHTDKVNDQPTITATPSSESGVPGFPLHTVHLTPASDPPKSQSSTTQFQQRVQSSTNVFPGFPTSIPESEATIIFHTEGGIEAGLQTSTSSACTTSITRLPSAVSGPTKIVYASTTTLTVLYPCGTCAMKIIGPPALTPAPTFTTTVTVPGVSTYGTAICTNFPWLDGMNGSQKSTATTESATSKTHRHKHSLSRVAARSLSEPTNASAGDEEAACTTTLFVDRAFETGSVKTFWTASKTITDVVQCQGCQLTVVNPNGVGPVMVYTSTETVEGASTTTTRICDPTTAANGYLGRFDLLF